MESIEILLTLNILKQLIDEVLEWQPIDIHRTLITGSKLEDHATQ